MGRQKFNEKKLLNGTHANKLKDFVSKLLKLCYVMLSAFRLFVLSNVNQFLIIYYQYHYHHYILNLIRGREH